ncbi:MAG: HPr family phosphocarrier protein [Clostridia bacterium]|nr:HPr family phosphocarrier protein [Clostridia bacterium]MBQ3154059.1 HPr family phosphocarrier protein [Clostridia bacterium]
MTRKDVTIQNEKGLHARPATLFIQKANYFRSSVWVENGDRKANAKSLLGVLSLAVSKGDVITLSAEGSDEAEAVAGLSQLIAELED